MIRRDLLITSALALIFLVSVNRATAENGKETMGAPENKVAKQKVYKLEEVVVTAKEAERRSLPYSVDITDYYCKILVILCGCPVSCDNSNIILSGKCRCP